MPQHKCSRKGCPCGGSTETTRYRSDANIWYCPIARETALQQKKDARKIRLAKPISPVCNVILDDGTKCGEPTAGRYREVDRCLCHIEEAKETRTEQHSHWYEENREEKLQYSKEYHQENRDSILLRQNEYRKNNKEDFKLATDLLWAVKWFRNFMVMKTLDRNFNFDTFCDQQSRQFVMMDFEKVGLFIRNEHSLIKPDSLRERKSIDCSIVSLGLYIETKSTEATYREKEVQQQVSEYKDLLEFEMANGYTRKHKATFISWSPTGDNSDMSLREFYLFIKDKVKYEYKRLGRERFKRRFPSVRYMALLSLCDKRAKQLNKVERYSPKSPKYNSVDVKQGLIERLLSGDLVIRKINMNKLREKYA
ncbi:MAG: hypothetical protein KF802_02790 [Bdellovibrionaceae bacterium]|nr:hypothetical protein [Pseudobdellovibrionaceae bacterium]